MPWGRALGLESKPRPQRGSRLCLPCCVAYFRDGSSPGLHSALLPLETPPRGPLRPLPAGGSALSTWLPALALPCIPLQAEGAAAHRDQRSLAGESIPAVVAQGPFPQQGLCGLAGPSFGLEPPSSWGEWGEALPELPCSSRSCRAAGASSRSSSPGPIWSRVSVSQEFTLSLALAAAPGSVVVTSDPQS